MTPEITIAQLVTVAAMDPIFVECTTLRRFIGNRFLDGHRWVTTPFMWRGLGSPTAFVAYGEVA